MDEQTLNSLFRKLSSIPDETKAYIFRPIIPKGKITLLSADPGTGKTKMVCGLVALITTGKPLFDIPCGESGKVLLFSCEDSAADLKATIERCGGDIDKVIVLGEDESSLAKQQNHDITFSSAIVEQAIAYFRPVLVVFDPLQRYVGKGVDTNAAVSTNAAFRGIDLLAKRYGCTFLIVAHNGKGTYGKLQQKTLGSTDIIGNVRSAISVVRDPEIPEELLALHVKSNNITGKTIRFKISSIPGNEDYATVEWLGLETYTEKNYWKAVKRCLERENAQTITDHDPVVATILQLLHDNPAGLRIRREDFLGAIDMVCDENVTMSIDKIVKQFGYFLKERHNILISPKTSQSLRPYKVFGQIFDPSKSPDRCLSIYQYPAAKTPGI